MARDDLHFRLRIPEDLKTRIEESAQLENRSMTAEIIERLERSFDDTAKQILDLQMKLAEMDGRYSATHEVFRFTAEIIAEASGNSPRTMKLLADGIRSMESESADKARAAVIESLANELRATAPPKTLIG